MEEVSCEDCGVCCLEFGSQPAVYLLLRQRPEFARAWNDQEDVPRAMALPDDSVQAVLNYDAYAKRCAWLDDNMKCRWYEHRPEACRRVPVGGDVCRDCRTKHRKETAVTVEQLEQLLGRKTAQLETNLAEYRKLLEITARMASGEIPPDAVQVDLEKNAWSATVPLPAVEPVADIAIDAPNTGVE